MKLQIRLWINVLLTITAVVLLCVSIFGNTGSQWPLCGAFLAIILANILYALPGGRMTGER